VEAEGMIEASQPLAQAEDEVDAPRVPREDPGGEEEAGTSEAAGELEGDVEQQEWVEVGGEEAVESQQADRSEAEGLEGPGQREDEAVRASEAGWSAGDPTTGVHGRRGPDADSSDLPGIEGGGDATVEQLDVADVDRVKPSQAAGGGQRWSKRDAHSIAMPANRAKPKAASKAKAAKVVGKVYYVEGAENDTEASKATSVERRTSYIHCSPAPEPLPGWHRPVQMDSLGEGGSFPAADHRCAALAEHITVHEAARVMRGCPVAGSQIYSECTFHNLGYSPSEGSLIGFRDQGGAVNSAPHWKVPGFGVERRHFPPTGGKVGESWGTAAAQPLEVRLVNSNAAVQCTRWVRDVAYLVHVFKQHSVWHTLESLFRVFQAYEQRQLRGTTLVLLNVESLRKLKGSTLELYEAFGLDVLTRAELAKETVCFAEAVAVGFPHHSLARPTANASTVDAFRSLFLDHWNLTAAYMETRAFRRPAVTVLSDSPSQATSKTASDR
ncbi:hypothetical protein CYMTET_7967, partial [Cymbomonas tetramitiformis]